MALTYDGTQGITFNDGSQLGSASQVGMRNRIINGAMVIDQRNAGASVTPTDGQYTLDRWNFGLSQASKLTTQQSSTAPVGFVNSLLVTSSSAYSVASGDYFLLTQFIEGYNIADLGWGTANAKTITLSFQVYSSLTGTFGGSLRNSAANRSYPFSYTVSSANTWTTISIIIAGDTTGTWLTTNGKGINLTFSIGAGSTYSGTAGSWSASNYVSATGATSVVGTSGATFYITGVQLEKGSVATPFEYRPYTTELQLCQRYFNIYKGGYYGGFNITGSTFAFALSVPVSMRTSPTFATSITDSNFVIASPSASQWAMYVQNSGWSSYSGSINSLSLNGPATNSTQYNIGTYGCTLGTAFTAFSLGSSNYFSFSAEL
jgi:hypothetical protein